MHVNDPATLTSPILVFLMGVWTALVGARSKREEKKRQEVKDEAEAQAARLKIETERAERFKADCELWRVRASAAEAEVETRNAKWSVSRTNYPEISDLIAIPGALALLREHRDKYDQSATQKTA